MKNSIKTLVAVFAFFLIAANGMTFAAGGSLKDNGTVGNFATVSLEVGKFAAITQLEDFVLTTSDADGSAGAEYSGSETFRLISNSPVHVILEGFNLYNGTGWVPTTWALDDSGLSFGTGAGVHNGEHTVSANVILGEISAQEASIYSAQIILTVAAL